MTPFNITHDAPRDTNFLTLQRGAFKSQFRQKWQLLLTQNLFHQGTNCRDISLNAKYLVLLKNVRDKNQFLYLARQAYPEDSQSLLDAHLEATRQPHGYLIFDFAQDTDDTLRFRTNVFPDEGPLSCMLP